MSERRRSEKAGSGMKSGTAGVMVEQLVTSSGGGQGKWRVARVRGKVMGCVSGGGGEGGEMG